MQANFLKAGTVPIPLREKVEEELDGQEASDIIKKVQFSRWATPFVPVLQRNGGIRLCEDYSRTVMRDLQKVSHTLPTTNEWNFSKLSGCSIFSKWNLSYAYLQLRVDDKSADILILNTPEGLYQVKRFPFGIVAAPTFFQRTKDVLLSNNPGVATLR